ncbi:MAG: HupE/UreJ family protein [Vicinamibacterales bacterium]
MILRLDSLRKRRLSRSGQVGPWAIAMWALVAVVAATAALAAHELERTKVTLSFGRDGSFVLDVANDPEWLLLRLEPFVEDFPDLKASAPRVAGRLPPAERDRRLTALGPVFADRVVIFVDGHEVRARSAEYLPPAAGGSNDPPALATYRLRGRVDPDARTLRWFYGIVADPYPLVVVRSDGVSSTEWIGGTVWSGSNDLTGQFIRPTPWEVMRQYLWLGYTHILPNGIDHILFVLGLFLLNVRLRTILIQVTAFTIAHSITLGLTTYGVVSLSPRIVEPLIALSIAYVAIENLVTDQIKPWRLALVFSFGLLHGMGFAGVLKELGLPRNEFLPALLSFNLGVEGGQLTVIAAAGLLVAGFRHREWYRQAIVVPASVAIAGVGLYWTVTRVFLQ